MTSFLLYSSNILRLKLQFWCYDDIEDGQRNRFLLKKTYATLIFLMTSTTSKPNSLALTRRGEKAFCSRECRYQEMLLDGVENSDVDAAHKEFY